MRRIAKKTRERVVELLRCAAELAVVEHPIGELFGHAPAASKFTGASASVRAFAELAATNAMGGSSAPDRDTFIANVLEAALRVELGEWPPHTHERRRRRG